MGTRQLDLFIAILLVGVVSGSSVWNGAARACDLSPEAIAYVESDYTTNYAKSGETLFFDGSASYDPDNPVPQTDGITEWEWDFDDDETDTGETTTHYYTSPGIYSVELWVTDDDPSPKHASVVVTVFVIGLEYEEDNDVHHPSLEAYDPAEDEITDGALPYDEAELLQGQTYAHAVLYEECCGYGAWLLLSFTTHGDALEDEYGEGSKLQPSGEVRYKSFLDGGDGNANVVLEGDWTGGGKYEPDEDPAPDGIGGEGLSYVELGQPYSYDDSKGTFRIWRVEGEIQKETDGPNPVEWSGYPSSMQRVGAIFAGPSFFDYGAQNGHIEVKMLVDFSLSITQPY